LGQAIYNAACISIITKKLYSVQNRSWHENIEKGSTLLKYNLIMV